MSEDEYQEEQASTNGLSTEFEKLRERRAQIAQNKTIRLAIPGYMGELVAEYRLLDWKEVRNIVNRAGLGPNRRASASSSDVKELNAQIDTLIAACNGLYFKHPSGEFVSLDCKFDKTLAMRMGFHAETARQTVLETFGNEIAITSHHSELVEWMQGQSEEVDEEFVGESQA